MAITVHDSPNLFCLMDGRLFYKVSSDNQFTAAGYNHLFSITFSSIPTNASDMEFSYDSGNSSFPFQFMTSPDDSGLQLPIGGATVQEFVDDYLIAALEAHADFFELYSVASTTDGVNITARNKGTMYNTATVAFSGMITRTTIGAGVDEEEQENFTIAALLEVDHDSVINRYQLEVYPYNSQVYLHLNKTLTSFYNKMARPTFGLSGTEDVSSCMALFRTRFTEKFGYPATRQKLNTEDWHYALPGGSSKEERANDDVQTFIDGELFLTHARSRVILPTSNDVLYYLHTSSETNFNVRATATLADTSKESDNIVVKTSVGQNTLWAIDCSPSNIATALSIDVADIVSISIQIIDISGPGQYFSEAYTFTVDQHPPRDSSQLLFQNSFGVYEYITLKGIVTKSADFDKKEVVLHSNDPAADESVGYVLQHDSVEMYTIQTGNLSKTAIEHCQELLRSPDVYLVESTRFTPVTVKGGKQELYDTDSGNLNNLKITITKERIEAFA